MTYTLDPFTVGFDRVFDRIERIAATKAQTYPPYNIIKTDETHYQIEMAVAGFSEDNFDVFLKDSTLTVKAEVNPIENEKTQYLHRGIAARSFVRTFTLADTVEVRDVVLEQGMLLIELENVIPEEKQPKKFLVKKKEPELLVE